MMGPTDVDRIVNHRNWYVLAGVLVVTSTMALPREMRYGIVTASALFVTGVHAGCLRRWRVEPGLWMLALLIGALTVPFSAMMIHYEISQCFAGLQPNLARPRAIGTVLDTAIGTKILWTLIWFLIAVTRLNWRVTRELKRNRSRPGEQDSGDSGSTLDS
jgi:hypothetical protein